MILDIELNDKIFDNLQTLASERGITVPELIRWIIGDHIKFSYPLPPTPIPLSTATERINKIIELMMKAMISQGTFKCPNCTMPLNLEAIEKGKCQACGAEI